MSDKILFSDCYVYEQINNKPDQDKYEFKNFIIGNLINDIFKGGKTKKNKPLFNIEKGSISIKQKEKFDILLPNKYLKKEYKCNPFTEFTSNSSTSKSYSIGRQIIDDFISEPHLVIKSFEEKFQEIFSGQVSLCTSENTKVCISIDEEYLKSYLIELKKVIIPDYSKDLRIKESVSLAYDKYYDEPFGLSKLLARIVLLLIISTKPKSTINGYVRRYYYKDQSVYIQLQSDNETRIMLKDIFIPISNYNILSANSFSQIGSENTILCILNEIEQNNYSESFRLLEHAYRLINEAGYLSDYSKRIATDIKYLYAEHLVLHRDYNKSEEINKGIEILKDICSSCGEAGLLLYNLYSNKYDIDLPEINHTKNYYLDKAVNLDFPEAIIVKIELILNKTESTLKNKTLLADLFARFDRIAKNSEVKNNLVARYYYCAARYYEFLGEKEKADQEYEAASKFGHEAARKILKRKDAHPREINEYNYQSHSTSSDKVCIINALNEETKALISTLPEEYIVWSVTEESSFLFGNSVSLSFTSVGDCIKAVFRIVFKNGSLNANSKVLFALFSDEEERNIDASLQLLDYLYNKAIEKECFSNLEFINIFDIFVKADFETASLLLDASLSEMNPEIYFKTHICDSALMASRELLEKTPLFISENKTSVLIIGDSKVCKKVFREAFAVGYMGNKHEVDFIIANNDIEKTKREIENAMPYIDSGLESNLKIRFANAELPFMPKEKGKDETYSEAWGIMDFAQALALANYIVIDLGSEMDNIKYSVNVRRWYERNYIKSKKNPIINVYCKSPVNQYWAQRLALDNTNQGNAWHNSFRLNFFGSLNTNYSFSCLTCNKLEKTAIKIHCSYYDTDTNNVDALSAFYSYSYNMDSSLVAALGLSYRFYIAGCFDEKNTNYEITEKVKEQYKKWLEENNDKACEIEQYRWNCFEVSRGWSGVQNQADLEEYLNYPELDNHKYALAFIHPYIANWDSLDDDGSIFRTVNAFYHRLGKTKPSPKNLTKENVATTLKWLDFEKEETLEQSEEKKEIEKDE